MLPRLIGTARVLLRLKFLVVCVIERRDELPSDEELLLTPYEIYTGTYMIWQQYRPPE